MDTTSRFIAALACVVMAVSSCWWVYRDDIRRQQIHDFNRDQLQKIADFNEVQRMKMDGQL